MVAVEGNTMSGVEVATMIRSISDALRPAASSAWRAAATPRSLLPTSRSAKWRARMPVRSTIQSSEVSTPWAASCAASSALVTRLGGRKLPVPVIREYLFIDSVRGRFHLRVAAGAHEERPGVGDAALHAIQKIVAGRIIRAVQGLLEGEGVGGAVTLEDQAAQTQEGGAVVAAVVHAALQRADHRVGGQRGELGERVAGEFLLEETRDEGRDAFAGLEHHVAHEAVAHDDLRRALEDVVAFHVAVVIEVARGAGGTQQFAGLLDHLVALDHFLADVQEAHGGVVVALHRGDERRSHHGELQ